MIRSHQKPIGRANAMLSTVSNVPETYLNKQVAMLSTVSNVVLRPEQRLLPTDINFRRLTSSSTFKQVQAQRK